MRSDALEGVALVTGGGRGIGASIARELTEAGMRVAVTGRTREQVETVAGEIGGLALVGDVSRADDVERWVETTERELGPIELLAANAGIGNRDSTWEVPVDAWWHVFEVNVLGVHLCCRGVIPRMLERGSGRIVITGSGAAYLPGIRRHCVLGEQGRDLPVRGDPRSRARQPDPGVLLQPRPRSHGDDRVLVRRRRALDSARARAATRSGARVGPR